MQRKVPRRTRWSPYRSPFSSFGSLFNGSPHLLSACASHFRCWMPLKTRILGCAPRNLVAEIHLSRTDGSHGRQSNTNGICLVSSSSASQATRSTMDSTCDGPVCSKEAEGSRTRKGWHLNRISNKHLIRTYLVLTLGALILSFESRPILVFTCFTCFNPPLCRFALHGSHSGDYSSPRPSNRNLDIWQSLPSGWLRSCKQGLELRSIFAYRSWQGKQIPGSTFSREIRAGLTTFFTMAYIIAVNV
jgi:hypothetical protein